MKYALMMVLVSAAFVANRLKRLAIMTKATLICEVETQLMVQRIHIINTAQYAEND
jgi:hypothetical protein